MNLIVWHCAKDLAMKVIIETQIRRITDCMILKDDIELTPFNNGSSIVKMKYSPRAIGKDKTHKNNNPLVWRGQIRVTTPKTSKMVLAKNMRTKNTVKRQ